MMITADGNLIGTLTDANGTAFDINGTIEKSGAFTASAAELNLSGKIYKTTGSALYGSLSSGVSRLSKLKRYCSRFRRRQYTTL